MTQDLTIRIDSNKLLIDSISQDSISPNRVIVSKEAITDKVVYSSKDSTIWDFTRKKILLYGDSKVSYQKIVLTGDYIEVSWDSSI